jgi:error-prone DNA polymerase
MVQAHVAAKEAGIRLVVGCRLDLADFSPVLVYPTDRAAYGRLCRLLTIGKERREGGCHLLWEDLPWGEGRSFS